MSSQFAFQWCGQYGAAVLNALDDHPTFHAPGSDSPDQTVRFMTLCGRRVLMSDLWLRADHAAKFAEPCQSCVRVDRARIARNGWAAESFEYWPRRGTLVSLA